MVVKSHLARLYWLKPESLTFHRAACQLVRLCEWIGRTSRPIFFIFERLLTSTQVYISNVLWFIYVADVSLRFIFCVSNLTILWYLGIYVICSLLCGQVAALIFLV